MKSKSLSIVLWFTIPPIVAALTFSVVNILCGPTTLPNVIDKSIWAMTVLLFAVLSILYGMLIINGWLDGLLPIQLIAQGLLLCPLALSHGATIFQWFGVLLTVCGAVVLVTQYRTLQIQQSLQLEWANSSGDKEESQLPIPFVVADESGSILRVSKPMLIIANTSNSKVVGQHLSTLMEFSHSDGTAWVGGKNWALTKLPMDGGLYYFQVSEKPKTSESGATGFDSNASGIDPETELMTLNAAITRLDEEIYRTRRYSHPLTAGLIRLLFPSDADEDGSADAAFKAWCFTVGKNLREPDISTASGLHDLMIALPECPKDSANTVIQKILTLIAPLAEQHPVLASITPLYIYKTYEGSDTIPDAQDMLDQMNQDLERKYTLNTNTDANTDAQDTNNASQDGQ